MGDRRRRRVAAVALTMGIGLAVAAPAVLAQTEEPGVSDPEEWEGSTFLRPFEGSTATVTVESFDIVGFFTKTRDSAEQIVRVDVRFEQSGSGDVGPPSTDDPAGDGERALERCVPEDPAPFVGEGSTDDTTASYEFTVPSDQSVWPCNGRYLVTAAAQSNQEVAPYELTGTLDVAVPPLPVTVASARYDSDVQAVSIDFEPLTDDELAPDALGYRIERAGPAGDDGSYGGYETVGEDLAVDDEPIALDDPEAGGDYRYRIRSLRAGPDGPVLAPAADSAVAEVTTPGEPEPTTTTTTAAGGTRAGSRAGGPAAPRSRGLPALTPTTIDTGFEETLDYGDGGAGDDQPELAGQEGRSIIRTEGEGAGLVAPVAGALVLLGWAGHVAYLNRLAREF